MDGTDTYVYARLNPIKFLDPSGLVTIRFEYVPVRLDPISFHGLVTIEFGPHTIKGDPERFLPRPSQKDFLEARDELNQSGALDGPGCGEVARRILKRALEKAGLPLGKKGRALKDESNKYYGLEGGSASPWKTTKKEVREAERRFRQGSPDSVTRNSKGEWILNIHHGVPSDEDFAERTQHLKLKPGMKVHISEGAGWLRNDAGRRVLTHQRKNKKGGKPHMLVYAGNGKFVDAFGKAKFRPVYPVGRKMLIVLRVYDQFDRATIGSRRDPAPKPRPAAWDRPRPAAAQLVPAGSGESIVP
jgi:hypothetical protein